MFKDTKNKGHIMHEIKEESNRFSWFPSLSQLYKRTVKIMQAICFDKNIMASRNGVSGQFRILYNEELHDLSSSPSIVRVMKTMRLRWGGLTDKKCIQNFNAEIHLAK
jgi:hypothetical protein